MAYHNHSFEFDKLEGIRLIDLLLNNTNAEHLDLEMDIYWVVRSGADPIVWFRKYPNRFRLIHIKHIDKSVKTLNTEIGTGSIDYVQILKKTRSAGVKYFIVEQENFKIDAYQSIAQSLKYLQQSVRF